VDSIEPAPVDDPERRSIFISHNKRDAEVGRRLGAQLKLVGADVWFDEWEIRAGDSIVGSVSDALESFDTFLLLWSDHAAKSGWVRAELEAALTRRLSGRNIRVIPIRLDGTPLPALVSSYKYLAMDEGVAPAVDEIMGFANDRERLRAIQSVLDEADIRLEYIPGWGLVVACPNCGASPDAIDGHILTDHERGDTYIDLRCTACGEHLGGGEI